MSKRATLGLIAMVVAVGMACGGGIDSGAVTDAGAGDGTGRGPDAYVPQLSSNKVDLLFAIDNSRSMGDKQALLAKAVPTLMGAFLSGKQFPAVTDMHVGIVSSSLGGGGAEQAGGQPICPAPAVEPLFNRYNAHNDDKAHLVNRVKPTSANSTGIEDTVPNARPVDGSGGNFLAWLPKATGKPNVPIEPDQATLTNDFQSLIVGVQEYGCGLEAQLESWYRFLVQPDPYDVIEISPDPAGGPPKASLDGIDPVVLKQRHDFLRPDSVVVVVQVTDEEDSWTDPLSMGGRGWVTRASQFPGSPTGLMPRGTSYCTHPLQVGSETTTGPNDPSCTSCGFAGNMANGQPISQDPACQTSCGPGCAGYYTAKDDNLNIRYVDDMKRRYGVDPQFPVTRYVNGLTSLHVPNRDGEHPAGGLGEYKGTNNCVNPLFAKTLPTDPSDGSLCDPNQQASLIGPRNSSLVYYVHVGGVPPLLVADASGTPKPTLTQQDWSKIVGDDPVHYDLAGIDPHMIESYLPRTAKNAAMIPFLSTPLADVTSGDTADPVNGREWDTTLSPLGLDLQFACTFALPTPKDCGDPTVCASAGGCACDCVAPENKPGGAPLCAAGLNGNSKQVRGKAYPTIRELRVAQALGDHAVVGSVCAPSDPFGPIFGLLGDKLHYVIVN